MEMEPSNTLPYMNDGSKSYDGFDVTITERWYYGYSKTI
jgi:hypothetical protein